MSKITYCYISVRISCAILLFDIAARLGRYAAAIVNIITMKRIPLCAHGKLDSTSLKPVNISSSCGSLPFDISDAVSIPSAHPRIELTIVVMTA